MAKPEWGAKRICHNCGAKYYDMRRSPAVCPKCGTQFDPEAFLKSRRSRSSVPDEKPAKKTVAPVEDLEDEVEETVPEADVGLEEPDDAVEPDEAEEEFTDNSDDDAVIEDTDDLGEDTIDDVDPVPGKDDDEDR